MLGAPMKRVEQQHNAWRYRVEHQHRASRSESPEMRRWAVQARTRMPSLTMASLICGVRRAVSACGKNT